MIALELGIPVILVPRESSIFCAAGMLRSDLKHDLVCTYPTRLDQLDDARFRALCREMREQGEAISKDAADGPAVRVAGRIMLQRSAGSLGRGQQRPERTGGRANWRVGSAAGAPWRPGGRRASCRSPAPGRR